jgi:hypothetical protein
VQEGFGFVGLDYGGNLGRRGIACAQDSAGALSCFGYEPYEGLSQPTPTRIATSGTSAVRQFAVGGVGTPFIGLPQSYQTHACLVDAADSVACWGSNAYGQLGDGTTTDHGTPATIPHLDNVVQVTTGGAHTCAVTTDGTAYCWGANNRGQLGIGEAGTPATVPQLVATPSS